MSEFLAAARIIQGFSTGMENSLSITGNRIAEVNELLLSYVCCYIYIGLCYVTR